MAFLHFNEPSNTFRAFFIEEHKLERYASADTAMDRPKSKLQ